MRLRFKLSWWGKKTKLYAAGSVENVQLRNHKEEYSLVDIWACDPIKKFLTTENKLDRFGEKISETKNNIYTESLILAQNERWRRG